MLVRSNIRAGVAVLVATLFLTTACAGEDLVFPDWTIDVPEGVPIHGYAGVPREERTERIEFVEDLVLNPTDPEIAFYRAWRFDVDEDDKIYIADEGHHHIVVFDRDGNFLRKFGREGRGPGEFVSSQDINVTGGRVVLGDWRARRLNIWDLEGNRLDEIEYGAMQLGDVPGWPWSPDSFVSSTIIDDRRTEYDIAIERYDYDLEPLVRYTVHTSTRNIPVGDIRMHDPSYRQGYAVERGGNVYVTMGDRAQVLAFDGDGNPAWALRTTWPAPVLTDDMKRQIIEVYRSAEGLTVNSAGWPDTIAAVHRILVDNDGRIWLYLRDRYETPENDEYMAVDIFDRDGTRLCACLAPARYWFNGRDDYVLAISPDPETEESRVVRYRVELPF